MDEYRLFGGFLSVTERPQEALVAENLN
jgi:hypothetical protein